MCVFLSQKQTQKIEDERFLPLQQVSPKGASSKPLPATPTRGVAGPGTSAPSSPRRVFAGAARVSSRPSSPRESTTPSSATTTTQPPRNSSWRARVEEEFWRKQVEALTPEEKAELDAYRREGKIPKREGVKRVARSMAAPLSIAGGLEFSVSEFEKFTSFLFTVRDTDVTEPACFAVRQLVSEQPQTAASLGI